MAISGKSMSQQRLMIYSDGGARGNPGPAAIAFIAQNEKGETVAADTRFIGVHTNNQAEYEALLFALKYAVEANASEVACYLDSELVTKQLNGEYAVKDNLLQQYWRKVREIKPCFKKISFYNVRRSQPQIQKADELVNRTLDKQAKLNIKSGPIIMESSGSKTMFVHTSIRTSNMERSIDFYSKFFGLKLLSRHEIKATNAEIAFLQDAEGKGCILELTFYRNQKQFVQPEYEERVFDHLGFEVADINKTLADMRKENVTITDEPFKFNEKTTIAFIEDPDGTQIELIERK
jgi:lactoylglutathione lyase